MGPSDPVWVPRWQRKVPTCPACRWQASSHCIPRNLGAFLWWGCGCPQALFAPGLCPLLSKPQLQLQALSQQAGQPCHSEQISGTRKVVAARKRKLDFP